MKKKTTTRKARPRKAAKRQAILSEEKLRENVTEYMQEEQVLLEQYGLAKRLIVAFPHHKSIPLLGRVALQLLKWSRANLDIQFGVKKQ